MIPYMDLHAQYTPIKSEILAEIAETFESTQFVLGAKVAAFEKAFAAYCGASHAVGVNSGTSALHLALLAAGIGPGDEVVTVSCTFVATVAAIEYTGARAVFVDVDPETLTMAPGLVEAAITERTKAILPVHLHGLCAEMEPILDIARHHGLTVVEDAAQAHGAEYRGRRAGSLGDMGCFSFYPGKNLGAYGEGGAVVTSNARYAERLRMLRDWGQDKKYSHVLKGYNYRMDGVQGAVLGVKLRYLEAWTEARRRHARHYDETLKGCGIRIPAAPAHCRHVYHVYGVRVRERDAVQRRLQEAGVATSIHYPVPVHLQPAYADGRYRAGDLPVTEQVADELLSLPMFAELTGAQIGEICNTLCQAVSVDS